MEIVHLILGKANPERMNGVNKVVNQLVSEQVNYGLNAEVWGISSSLEHNYPERNYKTRIFAKRRNPFLFSKELKQEVLKNRNAVYHFHGGWIPVFSSLAAFMKKNEIRYIITPHGAYNSVAMEKSKLTKRLYYQLFEKKMIEGSKNVHSLGRSEAEALTSLNQKIKSVLIPTGFNRIENKSIEYKNSNFIVGFVGRIDVKTKGLDLMVDAFAKFQAKHPKSELWIIGEGLNTAMLKERIAFHEVQNVRFLGARFGKQKFDLMQRMDVFVHSSRNEGLPTAVLEACSLGIPVLVSPETNLGEYVSRYNAGVSLTENTVEQQSDALELLHAKWMGKEIVSYKIGAEYMVEKVFSWKRLMREYSEMYAS